MHLGLINERSLFFRRKTTCFDLREDFVIFAPRHMCARFRGLNCPGRPGQPSPTDMDCSSMITVFDKEHSNPYMH